MRMPQPGSSFYEAARSFLIRLGAPLTRGNVNVVTAWMWCEKPHPDGAWQWNNPLNTTMACCNWVRNVNSAGVKEYPTREDGIEACVRTIQQSYYNTMRRALLGSNPEMFLAARGEISTWGTSPDCIASTYASLPEPPSWALEPPQPPPVPPPVPVPPAPFLAAAAVAAVALGGAGAGLLVFLHREKVARWWYNSFRRPMKR